MSPYYELGLHIYTCHEFCIQHTCRESESRQLLSLTLHIEFLCLELPSSHVFLPVNAAVYIPKYCFPVD